MTICLRIGGCERKVLFQTKGKFTNFIKEEHKCWDPKDGELCLARLKSGETLMEDRSDSDVQIDRRSWV